MELADLVLLLAVLSAVVVRQLSGRGPPIWASFGVGALLALALGLLPLPQALGSLGEALTLIEFLLGLFLLTSALERSGALDHLARWFLGRAGRAEQAPLAIFLGFGLLSTVVLNDALVVVGVPLLLAVGRRLRAPPRPLLLALACGVTVGSVATPFGNPQNLLVALQSGIPLPILLFPRYLLLPTAINLLVGGWLLSKLVARGPDRIVPDPTRPPPPRVPLFPPGPWGPRLLRHPVLVLFPATLGAILFEDVAAGLLHAPGVPLAAIALAGGLVALLLSTDRRAVLRGVDVGILLLFAGLFVMIGLLEYGQPFSGLGLHLPVPSPTDLPAALGVILGTSLVGSQVVSNVPWVALQIPFLAQHGFGPGTPVPWMALAGASTLAGNLTLLGAASNLIVVARAESAGVRIRLLEFMRVGVPLTLVTTAILGALLAVGL